MDFGRTYYVVYLIRVPITRAFVVSSKLEVFDVGFDSKLVELGLFRFDGGQHSFNAAFWVGIVYDSHRLGFYGNCYVLDTSSKFI